MAGAVKQPEWDSASSLGMDRRSWTLLLVLAAIWGASYLLIKIGVRDLSAPMIAFLRIAFGAAVARPARAPARRAAQPGAASGR